MYIYITKLHRILLNLSGDCKVMALGNLRLLQRYLMVDSLRGLGFRVVGLRFMAVQLLLQKSQVRKCCILGDTRSKAQKSQQLNP